MANLKKNPKKFKSRKLAQSNFIPFSSNYGSFISFKKTSLQKDILWSRRINIKITPNNAFCTLTNLIDNNILVQTSSGKCNIKCSRKVIRFASKAVIDNFVESLNENIASESILLKYSGPVRLRRMVLNSIFYHIRKFKPFHLFFDIKPKKFFNGCRPRKQRRKRNKRSSIFK